MTGKRFWDDPYESEHDTTIVSVDGAEVVVASTILFAFSGGQESDHGAIDRYPVLSARKVDHDIIYTIPEDHDLAIGQSVTMTIDWPRRYRLMRLHFAAELVLELTYRTLSGIEKIGAHISEEKARLDFIWPESLTPLLAELASKTNRLIETDLKITSGYEDRSTERRYWEISGFARVPCGGTHLRRTGEIGPVSLKRNNIGRAKERIEIFPGR